MKICPLITQSFVMDEKELLVHEADITDLDKAEEHKKRNTGGKGKTKDPSVIALHYQDAAQGDTDAGTEKPSPSTDDADPSERGVRFVAKSYRGEVECLGSLCRFHDEDKKACLLEAMLTNSCSCQQPAEGGELHSMRLDVEKIWEFQQKSTSEILGLFKELEDKNDKLLEGLKNTFDEKWKSIEKDMASAIEESSGSVKNIAEIVKKDIERKISLGEERIESFRKEITDWREILDKNFEAFEFELESNKNIVNELSENHSEILKLIELQKTNLADEERKRVLAEARRINNAGVVAYHNGQYEKALELFQKCTEIDPEFSEGYNNLGLTYTELDQEEKATEAFKKAIELNPDLAATYNNLGYVFYRLGSLQEAVEMYQEAIGRSKDNSSAYTNLGNAYYKLDRIEDAIEAWKKAIEIDPSNEKARRNLKRFHAEVVES
jgi:tetratricopeptide (TPR) repeat protein